MTAILENQANHMHQFGKKIRAKNDLHIKTGKFDKVYSTIDVMMSLLLETLATSCIQNVKKLVEKYFCKMEAKRKEHSKSNAETPKGQLTFTQYASANLPDDNNSLPVFCTPQEACKELLPRWKAIFDNDTKMYFFIHIATNTKCYHSPCLFEAQDIQDVPQEIQFNDVIKYVEPTADEPEC